MAIECMCEKGLPCLIHPKKKLEIVENPNQASIGVPVPQIDIDIDDKLQIKTLQAEALDRQLAVRDANDRSQQAQSQLNSFAQMMFDKYGKDPKKDVLDLSGPKFISRPLPSEG